MPYEPRGYQVPLWEARHSGIKRSIKVWHRRAGKDLDDFNFTIDQMCRRVGNYWHVYPYYAQARKAIWEGKTKDGTPYLNFIPKQLLKSRDKQQMSFELYNGSIWRLVGADNPDSLVGAGPCGVVYSEYSLQKPSVAEYIRPMILENDGWEAYNFTPRGENHAYDLLKIAENNPKWYVSVLTVDDTGVITPEQIAEERLLGKTEEFIQQEYYCSFKGSIEGAYYAEHMRAAAEDGRICNVPHDTALPVQTFWDLGGASGKGDSTAIWFVQAERGGAFKVIDYWEANNKSLPDIVREVISSKATELKYNYALHNIPHDGGNVDRQTGKTDQEILEGLGLKVRCHSRTRSVRSDFDSVRAVLPKCWFDVAKCKDGLNALKQYRKEYDEDKKCFKESPLHDWTSHGADAFRYFAVGYEAPLGKPANLVYPKFV